MGSALTQVLDAFQEAFGSTTNRRDAFKGFYRNYRQMYEASDEAEYTNNVFSTVTYETVETFRPYLTQRPPEISVLPRESNDQEGAERMEEWQRYQWYCQGMEEKRKALAFNVLLYGTAVLYHRYRKESADFPVKVFSRDGSASVKEANISVYDDPDCEVVDVVNDFFPDPFGRSVSECNYIVYRYYIHKTQLKAMSQGDDPWFRELPAAEDLGSIYDSYDKSRDSDSFDRFKDCKEVESVAKKNMVEILEYWEDDRLVIVANRGWVLRDTPNPYTSLKAKPFSRFVDVDNPHEFWGVGEGEVVAKGQHELNTLKRMRVDAAKRALRQGFIAPLNSGFDPSTYYSEDGYVCETAAPDFIKPINPPNLEQVGIPTEAEIKADIENATGATPLFKGSALNGGTDTATSSRIQQSNVMARANYKLDNFNSGLKRWMEMNVALAAQFYPAKKTFRVIGSYGLEFQTLSYVDLVAGADYEINSASSKPSSQEDRMMMADVIYARFFQNPMVKQDELIKVVMGLMNVPGKERMIKTPESMAAEQQAAMRAAQEQQDSQMDNQMAMSLIDKVMANEPEEVSVGPAESAQGQAAPAVGPGGVPGE